MNHLRHELVPFELFKSILLAMRAIINNFRCDNWRDFESISISSIESSWKWNRFDGQFVWNHWKVLFLKSFWMPLEARITWTNYGSWEVFSKWIMKFKKKTSHKWRKIHFERQKLSDWIYFVVIMTSAHSKPNWNDTYFNDWNEKKTGTF